MTIAVGVRRGWGRGLLAAGAAALLGLGGCSSLEPYLGRQPKPTAEEGAWAAQRDAATSKGQLYDGLSTEAFIGAVYQSPAVRQARVAQLATWEALPADERAALAAREADEGARWDDFLVTVFTPSRANNDLDRKNSIWRVAVVIPGAPDADAAEVTLLKADGRLRQLYPTIGDFDTVYRVRFARLDPPLAGRAFTLRFAGARGRLDLAFAPGPAAPAGEAKPAAAPAAPAAP